MAYRKTTVILSRHITVKQSVVILGWERDGLRRYYYYYIVFTRVISFFFGETEIIIQHSVQSEKL